MKPIHWAFVLVFSVGLVPLAAQQLPPSVRAIHSNLGEDSAGVYVLTPAGNKAYEVNPPAFPTLSQLMGTRTGYKDGIALDFQAPDFNGLVYYGFMPYGDGTYIYPVYVRQAPEVIGGKVKLPIRNLRGRYDMIGWEAKGWGYLGYRVVSSKGAILYDGKIAFGYDAKADSFTALPTVVEGPLLQDVRATTAQVTYQTLSQVQTHIAGNSPLPLPQLDGPSVSGRQAWQVRLPMAESQPDGNPLALKLVADLGRLAPPTEVAIPFRVRPLPVAHAQTFTFAYCSDSRDNQGGGERNVFGTNFYMVKRIGALAVSRAAAFVQFTGDLIDGYLTSVDQQRLQYANFKRALEPYWGSIPFICAPGNHEAHSRLFYDTQGQTYYSIDRYPYPDSSAEALFASEFANPISSLQSEDGAAYDPDPTVQNFPPYGETVFTYSYGNTAMVVLNSNYWYTVQQRHVPHVSGNIHAYIMDNQLAWLAHQLDSLERDTAIAHVFVTCHTPIFPNGGHVQDDMWYRGDNSYRPYVAGKPVAKGILERRDEILDLLVNQSTKVRATLTGDEHNYCRTQITEAMPRYPEGWNGPRLQLKRTIWQINNGSAGAPYYAQEQTPWSAFTQAFTTQVALVFVHVNGDKLEVEVQNPDTLEVIDRFTLR